MQIPYQWVASHNLWYGGTERALMLRDCPSFQLCQEIRTKIQHKHRECAPALSATRPCCSLPLSRRLTDYGSHRPESPPILLSPTTPPSKLHILTSVCPQENHLLHQKKSMSITASYSQPSLLNLQYHIKCLRSISFLLAMYDLFLVRPFQHTLLIFSFNHLLNDISHWGDTSVFCKVQFSSSGACLAMTWAKYLLWS